VTRASIIETTGVVAVVRLEDLTAAVDVTKALLAGGVTAIEFTFTNPKAGQAIDAARAFAGENWRRVLGEVRKTAVRLAQEGRVVITRKGKPVDPLSFKGVYRLKAPA